MKQQYKLTEEQKKAMRESIHNWFLEEMDEDYGFIKQDSVLEFFLEEMAPVIYNKALEDAKYWFSNRMNDLENDYYLLYKQE